MSIDSSLPIMEMAGIVGCLLASAFFSGSETALTTISATRAAILMEQAPAKYGVLKIWLESRKRILAALLIGNNLVNILCSILTYRVAVQLLPNWAEAISVFGLTLAVLIFAEITPKSLALNYSEKLAVPILRIVWLLDKLLFVFSWPLSKLPNLLVKNSDGGDDEPPITEDEIEFHIRRGLDKSVFEEKSQGELLMSAVEFSDTTVKDIMIPRTDMVSLEETTLHTDALKTVIESGHSRVPVFAESVDNIVGIIYAKDLLNYIYVKEIQQPTPISVIMRDDPFFAPETQKISILLTDMRRRGLHLAIVVDEFGGTAGVVTLEDIIEELVGEIRDEFDPEETQIKKVGDSRWQLNAHMSITDFEDETGLRIPDTGDYESVGGYVTAVNGRIPRKGKVIKVNQLNIIVMDSNERHIKWLEIRNTSPDATKPQSMSDEGN